MRRIADFASLYRAYRFAWAVRFAVAGLWAAAALHFPDLWVPNFGVQEFMDTRNRMLEVFPRITGHVRGRLYASGR